VANIPSLISLMPELAVARPRGLVDIRPQPGWIVVGLEQPHCPGAEVVNQFGVCEPISCAHTSFEGSLSATL
jgi:hypothetical protein